MRGYGSSALLVSAATQRIVDPDREDFSYWGSHLPIGAAHAFKLEMRSHTTKK